MSEICYLYSNEFLKCVFSNCFRYRIAYDEKNDNPSQLSLTIELMPDEKVTQEIDSDEEEEEYENLVCNNDSKNSSENDLTIKTNYMCESRNQEFET